MITKCYNDPRSPIMFYLPRPSFFISNLSIISSFWLSRQRFFGHKQWAIDDLIVLQAIDSIRELSRVVECSGSTRGSHSYTPFKRLSFSTRHLLVSSLDDNYHTHFEWLPLGLKALARSIFVKSPSLQVILSFTLRLLYNLYHTIHNVFQKLRPSNQQDVKGHFTPHGHSASSRLAGMWFRYRCRQWWQILCPVFLATKTSPRWD